MFPNDDGRGFHIALRWVVAALIGSAVLLPGRADVATLLPVGVLLLNCLLLHGLQRNLATGPYTEMLYFAAEAASLSIVVYGIRMATDGPRFTAALAIAAAYIAVQAGRVWGIIGAERRGRRESRELRALLEITELVTGTLDAKTVMSTIVQRVGELVRAQRCSILVVDGKKNECYVVAASDNPEASMLEVDLLKYPEIRRAVETREPVVVENVESDPLVEPVREILLHQGYRSMLVLPLVFEKEVLGTLFLRATRDVPFSESEIRFCRVAAAASANALKNALLYRDVTLEGARHRETGEKLRRVLDGSPDLIVATDEAGRITEMNRGAERLLGVPAEKSISRPLNDILGIALEDVPTSDPRRRDAVIRNASGDAVELSLAGAVLHADDGSPAGRVWIGRDVTEMRRVEKTLAQAERLSSLGEVVAGVAHELNNPLSSVLGYAQLLLDQVAEPAHSRDLGRVVESAKRCQRIVANLLAFSRKHAPESKRNDLNACIQKVFDLKNYQLRSSRIETVLDLDPELPTTMFDNHQIEQVVLNLINNAEQAISSQESSGRVVVRTRTIPGFVCVEVADDGPGVPSEIRHRVFDPFFTTKEVGKGTGLGLSVSYGILHEHGGRIELREADGGAGACFVVSLPLTEETGTVTASPAGAPAASASRPLTGRTVLVADDEPHVLDLLRRVLENEGAQVVPVADGNQAWQRILDQDFDLVVTDLLMPHLDGRALFEKVVAEKPEMLRRFVFATGDLVRSESLRFLEGLPERVIRKPIDIDTVRRVVARALAPAGSRA